MGANIRGVKAISETSIEITFAYQGQRCRERLPLKPTPANLKRAEQHRSAIMYAIATNSFDYPTTFPNSKNAVKFARIAGDVELFSAYIEGWLKRKKVELKTSTFNGYQKVVGQLVADFGALKLSEIKRKNVRDKYAEKEASNKTLANLQSVMRTALDDAVDDELIEVNPLSGWTYSKLEPPKEEDHVDPFSAIEQDLILKQATGQNRNLIQFALWTGLRTSELVALNWDDVDFLRGVVIISKAMTQHAEVAEAPKTASGRREVKLLRDALLALENQKQYTYLNNREIFQNPRYNERWAGDQPIRKTMFQPILRVAKVRYRNPYQTRHTYASMMLSAGEHPMWVANQMGHSDWTMIARVYGKWMPEADQSAGVKAENTFGNASLMPVAALKPA